MSSAPLTRFLFFTVDSGPAWSTANSALPGRFSNIVEMIRSASTCANVRAPIFLRGVVLATPFFVSSSSSSLDSSLRGVFFGFRPGLGGLPTTAGFGSSTTITVDDDGGSIGSSACEAPLFLPLPLDCCSFSCWLIRLM